MLREIKKVACQISFWFFWREEFTSKKALVRWPRGFSTSRKDNSRREVKKWRREVKISRREVKNFKKRSNFFALLHWKCYFSSWFFYSSSSFEKWRREVKWQKYHVALITTPDVERLLLWLQRGSLPDSRGMFVMAICWLVWLNV